METIEMSFESLGLMPVILKNVHRAGYETPTPIQQSTIPLVMAGKDVLGCAQTGTGKTAAFALPMIQQMAKKPIRPGQPRHIRQLILTPTRELAIQIDENLKAYGKNLSLTEAVIFGGLVTIACTIAGMPSALMLGALIAVMSLIPMIGALIGASAITAKE